jgi:hypothetical protein
MPSVIYTGGQWPIAAPSTYGQRADANYFTVDGVSANFGRTLEQTKKSE